jgi:hypothetical protein
MTTRIDKEFDESLADLIMIKPCLEKYLQGELIVIDKDESKLMAALDQLGGIDAYLVREFVSARGLGMRIQWGSWDTFTIRTKRKTGTPTDLQKYQNYSGGPRPDYIMHIYLRDGEIRVGTAPYLDLMKYVVDNFDRFEIKTAPDGNEFIAVDWDELEKEVTWFKRTKRACVSCSRKMRAAA